ncbi:MAG: hypothetical protein Q9167_005033 [Letrouitia subvulpina]
MEALGITASLVAVVTVTLQSTRFVYETISTVRDGPLAVKKLLNAIQDLEQLLNALISLRKHPRLSPCLTDASALSNLENVTKDCNRKLLEMHRRIDRLQRAPGERQWKRIVKHSKTFLHERDYESMWHTGLLREQGEIITRQLIDISSDLKQQSVSSTNSLGIQRDSISGVQIGLEHLSNRVTDMWSHISSQNTAGSGKFIQMTSNVCGRLENEDFMSQQQILALKALSGTKSNFEINPFTPVHQSPSISDQVSGVEGSPDSQLPTSEEAILERSIARLCSLACTGRRNIHSREAESAINDIGYVLSYIKERLHRKPFKRSVMQRKNEHVTKCSQNQEDCQVREAFSVLDKGLKGAYTITNNAEDPPIDGRQSDWQLHNESPPTSSHRGSVLSLKLPPPLDRAVPFQGQRLLSSSASWKSVVADFVLFIRTRFEAKQEHQSYISNEDFEKTVFASLSVLPKSHRDIQHQFTIELAQKITQNRLISLTPVISFRNIVSADSKIFGIALDGDIDALKVLLTEGKASLRDCDPGGRSLLSYSIQGLNVSMVKFLIEQGADVDAFEPNEYGRISTALSFVDLSRGVALWSTGSQENTQAFDCCSLLLEAGADPTIAGHLEHVIETGSCAALQQLLNRSRWLIDLNADMLAYKDSKPLWYLLSIPSSFRFTHLVDIQQKNEKMAQLLKEGADVSVRDLQGNTCLHLFWNAFASNKDVWISHIAINDETYRDQLKLMYKDQLMLMITARADVCSVNDKSMSVTDLASRCEGGYEIWTEALASCGIAVADVKTYHDISSAYSTGVDLYRRNRWEAPKSKLPFLEYLHQRKELPKFNEEWVP